MERNLLAQATPTICETFTLYNEVAGYAFGVKVGQADCIITAVTRELADYIVANADSTSISFDDPFYILKNAATIKDTKAILAELATLPDEQLKPLLVPTDEVYKVITET